MNLNQWTDLNYLLKGNATQAEVYQLLQEHKILDLLGEYNPILVGTVPIEINVIGSDLDIICEVQDFIKFELIAREKFSTYLGFSVTKEMERITINFTIKDWPIEVFGQGMDTTEQNGFKHMIIEYRMLELYGHNFKKQIIKLKQTGLKTEPAFTKLLNLKGDPYLKLLELYNCKDEELREMWIDSDDVA
ncbi:DUF4269 domain-containing protein [Paenibacillus sp. R14(2021)]|uniref:DUF4269 domain-containing protein n=1 Tax=Paenibacillus sp. R14(2021) TaxID=2859228 RepID=UPI001C61698A|nr:DUF4269 domain-containing protein [Paenibacillus sp. R14(2021)]